MASYNSISADKLARLIGTPSAPILIDVREAAAVAADPRMLPTSLLRDYLTAPDWAAGFAGQSVVVTCQKGKKLAEGSAAWLRQAGARAEVLDGGFEAWRDAGLPLIPLASVPPRNASGATVWVTRSRPKVDRIACPWLLRRFVDPGAVFLFVAPAEVEAVAERFAATPFDVEGVAWGHRGELCTFDVMLEEFALALEPLQRLATIVRGADTARPDLAPEVAGFLAVSLGLSRLHADDLAQLEAGMGLYDAFYRWCRDATDETHNWPNAGAKVRA
jgi:rhodanese-related sulfurtransferase